MNAFSVLFFVFCCFSLQIIVANSKTLESSLKSDSVIPDVIASAPANLLNATYSNGKKVNLGNHLTVSQTKKAPVVKWPYESNAFYALFMVDPDAPSRENPTNAQWLHWAVVNISANNVAQAKVLMSYNGPSPPSGSGFHRYVLLAYKQNPQSTGNQFASIGSRAKFNVTEYAKTNNLKELIAANFFKVKRN